jgi:hypothetical protein
LSPQYTEKIGVSREIRHSRKKRKCRSEFLQKCKNAERHLFTICVLILFHLLNIIGSDIGRKDRRGMKFLSTFEAAEKWGISHRRVSVLCNQGRITGAQRAGSRWIIPDDAEKPADARIKSGKYVKERTAEGGA